MSDSDRKPAAVKLEPNHGNWWAFFIFMFWIALLTLPMWNGEFLASQFSDQHATGYAFRQWLADQVKAGGHVPLWNPTIFGGLPFVAAMHGDIFYPTAWLRLILPTDVAMNLGFAVHYVLAAFFAYLLLRKLGTSWLGAVAGGFAYQLSGVIGSYVQPGHDGKLFVTALLPLALLGLIYGIRDRKIEGFALLSLTVGLGVLSPHYQMLYYALIVAGIFALYLTFGEQRDQGLKANVQQLGLALLAVGVGMGIAAIQLIPFFEYIPFSPRAEGTGGFDWSTSYGTPWEHVPEFFLSNFVGSRQFYWGSNALKLHSEYLGLPVVALAVLGALGKPRRRLIIWLGAIGGLFLLISLGRATPFYHIWYALMPFVKQTRAPGMAFFVVSLVVAILAGFGVERLEKLKGGKHPVAWMVAGGAVVLLAVSGGIAGFAESIADLLGTGKPNSQIFAGGAAHLITTGAAVSGVTLLLTGAAAYVWQMGRVPGRYAGLIIVAILSADLWYNARGFWSYTDAPRSLYAGDAITDYLTRQRLPYRLLDPSAVPGLPGVYPGSALMAFGIPQLFGHHGNELRYFDELWGGKNIWSNFRSQRLWELYSINYVTLPTGAGYPDSLPGFTTVLNDVRTSAGVNANLYVRDARLPYVRLAAGAARLPDQQAIQVLATRRFGFDRLVLLGEETDLVLDSLKQVPEPVAARAEVTGWQPGAMKISIEPALPTKAYMVVSENYYPDWKATVDGVPATVVRGDYSLITVPLPQGAREVELRFDSGSYRLGRIVSILSVLAAMLGLVIPRFRRKSA